MSDNHAEASLPHFRPCRPHVDNFIQDIQCINEMKHLFTSMQYLLD